MTRSIATMAALVLTALALLGIGSGDRGRHRAAPALAADAAIRTTDGSLAMGNLEAQFHALEAKVARGSASVVDRATLAEMLIVRAQYTGRIADRERALAVGESLAREFPDDPTARLAQCRGRAAFHDFSGALTALDAAAARDAAPATVEHLRAGISQALGDYDAASLIREARAARYPSTDTLAALASLAADRGEIDAAAQLYAAARARYRDVSPFPIAFVEFEQGLMAMRHGDLERARDWFAAAHRRLPAFAAAQSHLGEVEAGLGNWQTAVALLEPVARTADDPDAAAHLAAILRAHGRQAEAARWRAAAAARYEELLARYPDAYADHAAEFFLGAGADPQRALTWAQRNLAARHTARAYELVLSAAFAAGDSDVACAVREAAAASHDGAPALRALLARSAAVCVSATDDPIAPPPVTGAAAEA